jgi:exopolysaccharide biosynthesis polyprenyl glycosylphosphotransferase
VVDTISRPVSVAAPAEAVPARRRGPIRAFVVLALLLVDTAAIYGAYRLAYTLRVRTEARAAIEIPPASAYTEIALIMMTSLVITFAFFKLYIPRRGQSRIDLLYSVFLAVSTSFLLGLAVITLAYRTLELPRIVVVLWWAIAVVGVWIGRTVVDLAVRITHALGHDVARVLIVGAGEPGLIVSDKIQRAPELGYRVVGFVDDGQSDALPTAQPILGTLDDVAALIREHRVSEIILAAPHLEQRDVLDLVASSARERVGVKLFPDILQIMSTEVTTSDLGGLPMVQVRDVALRGWNLALKRAMDIVVSGIALVVLSPIMLLIAVLVKLTSRNGPVFYVQERVGLDGRPFQLVKFRSMHVDAEAATGPVWAQPGDDRRTALGSFIRRWSIDELPQLVNVFLGEMSLVGPRPERPHFVEQFSRAVPRYAERHNEKAGMTGWAQVNGLRGATSIEERTKYDVFYVENWSLAFDIKILLKTISAVFRDSNAY